MWKKLSSAREARSTPAVARSRSGVQRARLVLPANMASADRLDIYSDGNGRLAFAFSERGQFKVYRMSRGSKAVCATIPMGMASRIPFGTTNAALTRDGDMLVLDVSQFGL